MLLQRLRAASERLRALPAASLCGSVISVDALTVEVGGLAHHLAVGERARLGRGVMAEAVAVRDSRVRMLSFDRTEGLRAGASAVRPLASRAALLPVCDGWRGRTIDPLGRPVDKQGALPAGSRGVSTRAKPPRAASRARLGARIELGVRVLDAFTPCRQGQRLGLFAGPGVGKSTLLGMLARHARCDTVVLALIGERGREVREFIEGELGAAGLARAVVVVATPDDPPLMRREAAYAAVTVAEYFREEGQHVLLLMDSLTRFCMSLREIAVAAGEMPLARGYPASVFTELPALLERVGAGAETPDRPAGQVTGLFTVLVDGNDHDEPVADAVRGMLDGHVVLDRAIAQAGRYPAVDILRSLSRTAESCATPDELELARRVRAILSVHEDVRDLVRLGAYRAGADPIADEALRLVPRIEAVLRQHRSERTRAAETQALLRGALERGADVGV